MAKPILREDVQRAAEELMVKAIDLTPKNAMASVGALLLAAGSAAALARVPYADVVDLISRYYEATLVKEAERELQDSDPLVAFSKLVGGSN